MIISPAQIEDMKIRTLMLEATEICVRNGLMEHAKDIGAASKKMAQRIATHDYKHEDAVLESVNNFGKSPINE